MIEYCRFFFGADVAERLPTAFLHWNATGMVRWLKTARLRAHSFYGSNWKKNIRNWQKTGDGSNWSCAPTMMLYTRQAASL